jgi:hypothetical protein
MIAGIVEHLFTATTIGATIHNLLLQPEIPSLFPSTITAPSIEHSRFRGFRGCSFNQVPKSPFPRRD